MDITYDNGDGQQRMSIFQERAMNLDSCGAPAKNIKPVPGT
jgi:hypothetical protein